MAQLVERLVRNEEASGSNPLISTKTKARLYGVFFVLWISVHRNAVYAAGRARSIRSVVYISSVRLTVRRRPTHCVGIELISTQK